MWYYPLAGTSRLWKSKRAMKNIDACQRAIITVNRQMRFLPRSAGSIQAQPAG